MAVSAAEQPALLKLKENLACKICFDEFNRSNRKPMVLANCGHTFCMSCLTSLYSTSKSNRPQCPMCKKAIKEQLDELIPNWNLLELLDDVPGDKQEIPLKQNIDKYQDLLSVYKSLTSDKIAHFNYDKMVTDIKIASADAIQKIIDIQAELLEKANKLNAFYSHQIQSSNNEIKAKCEADLKVYKKSLNSSIEHSRLVELNKSIETDIRSLKSLNSLMEDGKKFKLFNFKRKFYAFEVNSSFIGDFSSSYFCKYTARLNEIVRDLNSSHPGEEMPSKPILIKELDVKALKAENNFGEIKDNVNVIPPPPPTLPPPPPPPIPPASNKLLRKFFN